jgi:hypothetical protein
MHTRHNEWFNAPHQKYQNEKAETADDVCTAIADTVRNSPEITVVVRVYIHIFIENDVLSCLTNVTKHCDVFFAHQ